MASVGSILSEMKRRRVFRVLAGYCAAALIAIEAANNIFPALEFPPWAMRLVVVLALVGLPVAIILAWTFDLTAEGLTRDTGARADGGGRRRRGRGRGQADRAAAAPAPAGRARGSRLPLYVTAAVVLALAGVAAYGRFGRAGAARGAERSVAVLPFANLSGDPANEYFSDGVTEEILNALANVPGLRVPARTSSFAFKGKSGDVAEIGRQLRVSHVLEGSVQRAGGRVRITAQLVDARTGYHLWSRAYTLEPRDLFAAEDEISRDVARQLQIRLDRGARLARGGTGDPRAHDLYLQARAVTFSGGKEREDWKANLLEAIRIYQQALQVDSTYALAWSGISDAYAILADDFWPPRDAYPQARSAALRALALDPDLAEAHNSLSSVLYFFDWNYAGGDRENARTLELNPASPLGHGKRAFHYLMLRRFADAARESETAGRLDPGNVDRWRFDILGFRALTGEADHLLDSLRAAMAARPGDLYAHGLAYEIAFRSGRWKEAAALLPGLHRKAPGWQYSVQEAMVLARAGDTLQARRRLDETLAYTRGHYVRPAYISAAYAALGERESALQWLERAYDARDGTLLELHVWDWWDPLRGDPRFEAVKRRVPRAPPLR
ncbi:MAG: hypothetical protein ACJ8GN_24055 [Longimicrobiaceae bacterium]